MGEDKYIYFTCLKFVGKFSRRPIAFIGGAMMWSTLMQLPSRAGIAVSGFGLRRFSSVISTTFQRGSTLADGVSKDHPPVSQLLQQPQPMNSNVLTIISRGYRSYMSLTKRCDGCFFIWREGRLHVECHKKPKHKQRHTHRIQEVLRNRGRKLLWDNSFMGPNDSYPTYHVNERELKRYVQRSMAKVK